MTKLQTSVHTEKLHTSWTRVSSPPKPTNQIGVAPWNSSGRLLAICHRKFKVYQQLQTFVVSGHKGYIQNQ